MTSKTLNGIYTSAYYLTAPLTKLTIGANGYVGAGLTATGTGNYGVVNRGNVLGEVYGVDFAGSGSVNNTETIRSSSTTGGGGILLGGGGRVTNGGARATGALISGFNGITIDGAAGTVFNDGTVLATGYAGIDLEAGGMVTNGSRTDASALIQGHASGVNALGAAATIVNFGAIRGVLAVRLIAGGYVVNGAPSETAALIEGTVGVGVYGNATVNNFGTIRSTGLGSMGASGIYVEGDCVVTNGAANDTEASIQGGYAGVAIYRGNGTITNFGSIGGAEDSFGVGVVGGGMVTNGSVTDTTALVQGGAGVLFRGGVATVSNFGTIQAGGRLATYFGIELADGGVVTNGAANDLTAQITGFEGIYASGPTGVINFGAVIGVKVGVYLKEGGQITNGSNSDATAVISGSNGAVIQGAPGTISNYGTMIGGVVDGVGASLIDGGILTNGSAQDTEALIKADKAVSVTGATVTNFGTIAGNSVADSIGLELEMGSIGANGSKTDGRALISGFTGVQVGVGSTLINFGTIHGTGPYAVYLAEPSAKLITQAGSVIQGEVRSLGATVTVTGATTMTGLVGNGTVNGAGILTLSGGFTDFSPGCEVSVSAITISGDATTVTVAEANLAYAGIWTQKGGTLSVSADDALNFSGAGDVFSGTLAGAGTIDFAAGSDTLAGTTLRTAALSITEAAVTLSGAIANQTMVQAATSRLVVAAAGATLTGAGSIVLTNAASNKITGATAGATLSNVDNTISGAGSLGAGVMTLANGKAGVIDGDDSITLAIDTGAATIVNAGLIEATGSGGVTIAGAVNNTGTLAALDGALTVMGAVTGAGGVTIGGGATAAFAAAFSENVTFTDSGVLSLGKSEIYTGMVSGFSKAGATSLDLLDIAFAAGRTRAVYSGDTKSGVLTVTDGTHTSHITLSGDFTASSFTIAGDGHGGTLVSDPPKAAVVSPSFNHLSVSQFIDAMAGLGGASGAELRLTCSVSLRETLLVRPHASFA